MGTTQSGRTNLLYECYFIRDFESSLSSLPNHLEVQAMSRWNSIKKGAFKFVLNSIPDKKHRIFTSVRFASLLRHFLGLGHNVNHLSKFFDRCNKCEMVVLQDGSHSLDCKKNSVYRRHDDIKTIVAAACSNAGLRTKVELSGANPESQERPADVAIFGWDHSDAWVDVAVVNPGCASHKDKASRVEDYTLDLSATNKRRKYGKLARDMDVTFIPFIMDVYGNLGKEARACLKRICGIGARRNGLNPKEFYKEILEKLVCSVGLSVSNQLINGMVL
jgi:hypothetical protein